MTSTHGVMAMSARLINEAADDRAFALADLNAFCDAPALGAAASAAEAEQDGCGGGDDGALPDWCVRSPTEAERLACLAGGLSLWDAARLDNWGLRFFSGATGAVT